jgi:hypothetical protein
LIIKGRFIRFFCLIPAGNGSIDIGIGLNDRILSFSENYEYKSIRMTIGRLG